MQLISTAEVAKWILNRESIWQMRLLNSDDFARLLCEKGLPRLSASTVERLWQLGALRADVVICNKEIHSPRLEPIGQSGEAMVFADVGSATEQGEEFGAEITEWNRLAEHWRLLFHPFRYLVVLRLQLEADRLIPSIGSLFNGDVGRNVGQTWQSYFPQGIESVLKRATTNDSNQLVSLAVACEPLSLPLITGERNRPAHLSIEVYQEQIEEYTRAVRALLTRLGMATLEDARAEICRSAANLERNGEVLELLRLARGDSRGKLKGRLGGAVLLLTMAETLRRAAESAFEMTLPEETDIAHASGEDYKERFYGSKRLFDQDVKTERQFLRHLGLDRSVKLRWYFEGHTEEGALQSYFEAFGLDGVVDLINLKGQVLAKRELLFRDNLVLDMEREIFSFVSIDKDKGENVRALRKVAQQDRLFGRVFEWDPDFELGNFAIDELIAVLWAMAVENGAKPSEKNQFCDAVKAALGPVVTVNRIMEAARTALSAHLGNVEKGVAWGRGLMEYALTHPRQSGHCRPIIEAVLEARRCCGLYDYQGSRRGRRVDAKTGRVTEIQKS